MPSIPKVAHFIWFGSRVNKLQKDNLKKCAEQNPDYEVNLWIDAHSMFAGEQDKFPGVEKIAGKVDKAIQEGQSYDVQKLTKKHGKFLEARGVPLLNGPVGDLADFCRQWRIQLRFADLIYDKAQCANIIHFEKVVRGGNLGAASDILRVEILHRYGGIYFDHDTVFVRPLGQIEAKHGMLFGVTQNVISNAVMAATAGHPEIELYRSRIFEVYQKLFSSPADMLAFFREQKASADQLETIQSQYEKGTLERTGPSALRSAHAIYKEREQINGFARDFWFPKDKVTIESAKAWL